MNLVLQTWPKCVQGGGEGVKKPENFAYVLNGWPLTGENKLFKTCTKDVRTEEREEGYPKSDGKGIF